MAPLKTSQKLVVIIGGGFSGLAVAAHLVEKASSPIKITLIEKNASIGPGIAFGTVDSAHPLNVVAENMGLFADNPQGFYEWLLANDSVWRRADASFADLKVGLRQYLPRKLYGTYLKDIFAKTVECASQKNIEFEILKDEALDIEEGLIITTLKGRRIPADAVVLAVSVPTNKSFSFENPDLIKNPGYIRNLWQRKEGIPQNSEVAILGTGLTTVDALWSLQTSGFNGHVHVISRSGKFPQSHAFIERTQMQLYNAQELPNEVLGLFRFWHRELNRFRASGADWRHLVEALRPYTTSLWQQFDLKSKKQFLRHVLSLWNRHRHRMSPESGHLLAKWIIDGRLKVHRGRIVTVTEIQDGKLSVQFISKEANCTDVVSVDCVINCTGPEYALSKWQDPFVRALVKKGLVMPDALGLGFKSMQGEMLAGKGEGRIFALGSLLFGERFETTSVPDIRVQAASIAQTILFEISEKMIPFNYE